ncbi:hypothetical protein SAMN04488564_10860 [Lentzea waywayandensis]|uniref:Uncharacterized protein n=1 Tax=Lentzea waywayandensis TaxID=84724 RepID=A0A1I6F4F8_9PSEU|nr:GTPase domain-containing protein [Lentzea waywayandensis]SFR24770.1 hypothetical protein SAMN04488564_10860 [Lentzea waywayandensis]
MGALAVVGFVVLAPFALVAFVVAFAASTAIGVATAVGSPTRLEPVAHRAGEDPAHRLYLAGPAFQDVWRLSGAAVLATYHRLVALPDEDLPDSMFARMWRRRSIRNLDGPLVLPPAGLAGGYALGFLTVTLLIAFVTALHAVLAGTVVLAVRATACGLRWFEIITLTLRGITTECGTCEQRARPAFTCACGRVHHNLVPGAQGVFRRTCLCGHRLPALLLNGKHSLPASCGRCHSPLPPLAQSVPAVHLPVVGGTTEGRSAFLHAVLSPRQPAPVHRILLGEKNSRRLVHLYDTAGDTFEHAAFLGLAGGVILVVDPFPGPGSTDPKLTLDRVTESLTELRGTAIPLAVVITRTDALPGTGDRSMTIRRWLLDHGRVDLVNTAQNHFTRVHYFVAADDPWAPVHWLLGAFVTR